MKEHNQRVHAHVVPVGEETMEKQNDPEDVSMGNNSKTASYKKIYKYIY